MNVFEMILALCVLAALWDLVPKCIDAWRRAPYLDERLARIEESLAVLDSDMTLRKIQLSDYEEVRKTVSFLAKGSYGELPSWFMEGRRAK